MILRKMLGAMFVSLFLIPVYLPQYAFAACCVCNNGLVTNSPRGCSNCGCGGGPAGIQCIQNIDKEKGEVTFKDRDTGKVITIGYDEKVNVKNMKVGQCGNVSVEKMTILECTGFAAQSSGSSGQ
jgi:hypothetical protein